MSASRRRCRPSQPMTPPALDRVVQDVSGEGSRRSMADRAGSLARAEVDSRRRLAGRVAGARRLAAQIARALGVGGRGGLRRRRGWRRARDSCSAPAPTAADPTRFSSRRRRTSRSSGRACRQTAARSPSSAPDPRPAIDLGAADGLVRRHPSRRHRRRSAAVLVARQPLPRVLRCRSAQESAGLWRADAAPL